MSSFIGLYGDTQRTSETAKDFKVFYRKVPTGSSYTMDHSAFSYVFDAKGKIRLVLRHEQSAQECTEDLRKILQSAWPSSFQLKEIPLMRNRIAHVLTITSAALLTAHAAHAQVTVKDAWVRATVPQQKATGAFMQLSAAKDTKLVSASSPVTPLVEVHEMAMQDNVMRMRQVPALDLPAGKTVELKPGGYHVMLLDLKQQVKEGDTVPLTLVFEGKDGKRESVEVKAPVRALNASAQPAGHGSHKH